MGHSTKTRRISNLAAFPAWSEYGRNLKVFLLTGRAPLFRKACLLVRFHLVVSWRRLPNLRSSVEWKSHRWWSRLLAVTAGGCKTSLDRIDDGSMWRWLLLLRGRCPTLPEAKSGPGRWLRRRGAWQRIRAGTWCLSSRRFISFICIISNQSQKCPSFHGMLQIGTWSDFLF